MNKNPPSRFPALSLLLGISIWSSNKAKFGIKSFEFSKIFYGKAYNHRQKELGRLHDLTVVHFNPEKREFSLLLNIPRPPYSMLGYNRTITRTNINVLINIGPGAGGGEEGKEEVKMQPFQHFWRWLYIALLWLYLHICNYPVGWGRGGGAGRYSTNVYSGRSSPEVQPLTLLYTMFHEKGAFFVYFLLTNGTPFTRLF